MNQAAAHLLNSLAGLGVESVRFRILGQGRTLRHTAPVAVPTRSAKPMQISVIDLFGAYAITPRQGIYELNVANGNLAFTPPTLRTNLQRWGLGLLKKPSRKSKSAKRGTRSAFAAPHHEIAA